MNIWAYKNTSGQLKIGTKKSDSSTNQMISKWAELKGVEKKGGILNFITYISSKKKKYIHFYSEGFINSIGLRIIQDFTAHWAI